jgi:hypothetical protein
MQNLVLKNEWQECKTGSVGGGYQQGGGVGRAKLEDEEGR